MKVPQFKSFIDKSDYKELEPVFENNYIAEGKFANLFQDNLLELIGAKYGCFACNGTLAIYLGLKALGIKAGDKVIVQNTIFIATANAVEMVGAIPIFVDILSFDNPSIDLNKVKLDSKTKAICIAHLFGTACSNIEEIANYCKNNNLFLIEDSAQALGIKNKFQHCGTYGDIGTFSFYADKTITTGEGGFVITNNEKKYYEMLYLRNQGRLRSGSFIHPEIGYNFRITDLQAALGLSQLKKLEYIKKSKLNIYNLYKKYLGDSVTFLRLNENFSHIPFRIVVFVNNSNKTMKYLEECGIEPRSVFYPLHKQPCYSYLNNNMNNYSNSIECYSRGICLPTWVGLTEEEIKYVSDKLIKSL